MNHLNEETAETINLIQEAEDLDVRDALRGHLEGLLEMCRDRIARTNVVGVRLGRLVHQNPWIQRGVDQLRRLQK